VDISEKTIGDVNVISLSGRLDAYSANEVEKKLDSLIDAAQVRLVISLRHRRIHPAFQYV
jgi:anti-anti-sigma regulatory factor